MTPAQNALIKAAILADPVMNAFPNNPDGAIEIANLFNLPSDPVVMGWRTDAPVDDIMDAITWTSYTPVDAPTDSSTTFANRAWVIKIKQMNLQNMLFGRQSIDCSKAGIRSGLRDAVVQLPAGTNGNPVSAAGTSGVNLLTACTRPATRIEALLAAAAQSTGTVSAVVFVHQGPVSYPAIETARYS